MEALNNTAIIDHPYYPLEVEITSYLANEWSVPTLLGLFAGLWAVILLVTSQVVSRVHKHLPLTEKAAIWWFVLCKYYLASIDRKC
jgi:cholestenol delta-isomerase